MLATARAAYANQVSGRHSLDVLHRVGSDPILISDLQAHNAAAARAYVAFKFRRTWYHWHVSRMRVSQGGRRVTEIGVPFVLPPSSTTIRGTGGRPVGTLDVSMQDEIGFVRLMHRHHPVQVVLRGRRRSTLRTSLHAAALVKLPRSGTVRLGHTRYQVRSFQEQSWEDGPVTIWILMK
jgi:hypothetical protein